MARRTFSITPLGPSLPPLAERPIYVAWDNWIDDEPAILRAVLEGIRYVQQCQARPATVKLIGTGPWPGDTHDSVEWYLERAWLPDRRQIDGDALMALHAVEPWQEPEPHRDFLLLHRDMTIRTGGELLNFVFGVSNGLTSIQSLYRFTQGVTDRGLVYLLAGLVAIHEFGHMVGLVADGEPNADPRPGLYQNHCVNLCATRQIMSVREAADLALALQGRERLCAECRAYLAASPA